MMPLIFAILFALKVAGLTQVSWWVVFSPFLISFGLIFITAFAGAVAAIVKEYL